MKPKEFIYYVFFVYFIVCLGTASPAERSTTRPSYEYGKSDAYDKANANNAHYQEVRPAASFNRFTVERTQLQRSIEEQRKRKAELQKEERNSYKQQ